MSEIWVVEFKTNYDKKWKVDYDCGVFEQKPLALSELSIQSDQWKNCDFRVAKYTRTEPQE